MNLRDPHPALSLSGASVPHFDPVYFTINQMIPSLAFGFLASQEVKDAHVGNLGLWDRESSHSRLIDVVTFGFTERLALHWVQKYIHAFGGDPSKVTM